MKAWPQHIVDQRAAQARDSGVTGRDVAMALSVLQGMRDAFALMPTESAVPLDVLLQMLDAAIESFSAAGQQLDGQR